jgi:hypothetical protein
LFIGHLAVGFAAKRAAPRTSLGLLIAAPLFLDLLWPFFLLLGWERVRIEPGATRFTPLAFDHYPWTHSLAMTLVWGALFGGLYYLRTRYRVGALVLGAGVVSHWVFDWITHRPDLALWPGSTLYTGLGLWNWPAATIVLEMSLFSAGLWLYLTTTRPLDRIGRWGLALFVVLTLAIYVANAMGPPPPSASAVAATALALWLFPLWLWWADRHRASVMPPQERVHA